MADTQTTFSESTENEPSPSTEEGIVDKGQTNIVNNTVTMINKCDDKDVTNVVKPVQNKLKRKKKQLSSVASTENVTHVKKRKTKQTDTSNIDRNSTCDIQKASDNQNDRNALVKTDMDGEKRVVTKPPLPPKPDRSVAAQITATIRAQPPRLKRKLEEQNTALVQKLSAHAEQMRLEISDLKAALANERTAVRSLRAQNEAESRKAKVEAKKLQCALDVSKKAATNVLNQKKLKEDAVPCKDNEVIKLSHEVSQLKETNKVLEDKIQIYSEAERRKTSDIHELKDSYEIRLTQISKSAKIEISRLLEEIKTKERNIVQLKKEVHTLKNCTNKKDSRIAQHPTEMKKLKDIERTNVNNINNNNNTTNQKCNITTCGQNEFNSMPHEITERILEAHDDLHIFVNKDPMHSDSDSALSSAPPSISPQPPANGEVQDIWQSVKNYSKELTSLQSDNESLQSENEFLKKELETLKEQLNELEKSLLEAHKNDKMQQLNERIQYLECREDLLLKEAHELREQNELLEFRILEIEDSHDKWSLRSNSNPDTRDMWTDTEREPDDLIMYVDRTDSGITSPHSHHHIDERNISSPYDLSMLDQVSNEDIKRRIMSMTKRNCYDEEDKLCLLQVLALLNNLEALSQDSIIGSDEMMSLDLTKTKTSDYSSASSSPRSFIADPSFQKTKGGRIVATVLPFSSTLSTPADSPRKLRCWNSSSLQESGVFEGELNETVNQSTQTDLEDFQCQGELCAEIQKLNKFREKIEEVVTKSTTKVPPILSPNLSDQKRLQYYKDRLELLENKVLIYESSGDLQTKRLAERLQREIQLNSIVKELRQRVDSLEEENLRLEEEKCEFEEAENDTRLRLQRLEVDLEILGQSNIELEMSKDNTQSKLKESRQQCASLQGTVQECQEKIRVLEESEKELKNRIDLIKTCMPAILLYSTFRMQGPQAIHNFVNQPQMSLVPSECSCSTDSSLHDRLHELMSREQELTQRITELNRAYDETLESADNLWAQMEKDYKDRLATAKNTENCMKTKICQLEERLTCDLQCAQERISQLEEIELSMKHRICKLNKENKDMTTEHEALLSEYHSVKDKYYQLKAYLEGPAVENLDKERVKSRALEEDLAAANKMLEDVEEAHRSEIQQLRNQLAKVNKELLHIEVTNSELKEEVNTLETQVMEMSKLHKMDEDKIRNLTDELRLKEDLIMIEKQPINAGPSLAQELGPVKRVSADEVSVLSEASMRLAEAITNFEECGNCSPGTLDITAIPKEIKSIADAILSQKSGKKMRPSNEVGSKDSPDKKPESIDRIPGPNPSTSFDIRNFEDLLGKDHEADNEMFNFQTPDASSMPGLRCGQEDSDFGHSLVEFVQAQEPSCSQLDSQVENVIDHGTGPLDKPPQNVSSLSDEKQNNNNPKTIVALHSILNLEEIDYSKLGNDFLKESPKNFLEKYTISEEDKLSKPTMAEVPSEFRKISKSTKSRCQSFFRCSSILRRRKRKFDCIEKFNCLTSFQNNLISTVAINDRTIRMGSKSVTSFSKTEAGTTKLETLESSNKNYANPSSRFPCTTLDSNSKCAISSSELEICDEKLNTFHSGSVEILQKGGTEINNEETSCISIQFTNTDTDKQTSDKSGSLRIKAYFGKPFSQTNLKLVLPYRSNCLGYQDSSVEQIIEIMREEVPYSSKRQEIEWAIRKCYETDDDFHKNLDKTMDLGLCDPSSQTFLDYVGTDSFEEVVRSLKCLKTISNLFAPSRINKLIALEEDITRKLILFYLNKNYDAHCDLYM